MQLCDGADHTAEGFLGVGVVQAVGPHPRFDMEDGEAVEKAVFGSDECREGIALDDDGRELSKGKDLMHLREHFGFELA